MLDSATHGERARQLGGVLGIAVLVVILGEPTPATAVDAFHDGWLLSIVAFLLVAVVALPLGKLRPPPALEEPEDHRPALVYPPAQRTALTEAPLPVVTSLTDLSDVPSWLRYRPMRADGSRTPRSWCGSRPVSG